MSLVGFCGSRSLPPSATPLVAGVVSSVLSSRRSVAVGCCVGADACVLSAVLAAGAAPRLCVFAAFGPVSPPCGTASRVEAPGASRSLSWPSRVGAALRAGASVRWWSGGGPVFAVHDCGFRAHCTLEIDDAGRVRMESIYDLIRQCRFGVHDISRTELDPVNNLPRFNMPLEPGLFLGATRFGSGRQRDKRSLILDREQYRYQKYISDIAGQDIKAHDDRPGMAIRRVRDWLDNSPVDPDVMKPGARKMTERYERFISQLPELCEELHLHPEDLTFNNFTDILEEWLRYNEW